LGSGGGGLAGVLVGLFGSFGFCEGGTAVSGLPGITGAVADGVVVDGDVVEGDVVVVSDGVE
jgi:hypothetical protein